MKISTKGRYALRMMLDLAEHQENGFISLKDIAQRQNISKKYLEQIRSHPQKKRHFKNDAWVSGRLSPRKITGQIYSGRNSASDRGESVSCRLSRPVSCRMRAQRGMRDASDLARFKKGH